jgi:hypothetical protein
MRIGAAFSSSRRGTYLLLGMLLLPIAAAYAIMARFSVNVPIIDDYDTIMDFAVRYQALPTAGARLHYILADQYVEYKLVFLHLFTAGQLALVHHLSFSFTFWVGNVALLALLFVSWSSFFAEERDLERRLLLFAPMVFFLFSLNYAEAVDWVACDIGYILTIVFSLLSLHLLAGETILTPIRVFACACLCALLACTIAANAFLLLPLGLLVLLPRRAYLRAVFWCACFLLALVPYLVHYAPDMHSGSGPFRLIPLYFLSFIGGASPIARSEIPAGCLVLAIYAAALRSGFHRTHRRATLAVTWLLASAALAAVGRGRTGVAFSRDSRYKIYADLILLFCYGFLATRAAQGSFEIKTKRRLLAATLAVAVLFCIKGDYAGVRILRTREQMVRAAFHRYRADPQHNSPMYFNQPAADGFFAQYEIRARDATNAAVAAGLYDPPR